MYHVDDTTAIAVGINSMTAVLNTAKIFNKNEIERKPFGWDTKD